MWAIQISLLLSIVQLTWANTEIWKLKPSNAPSYNTSNDEHTNIHHISPLQINNILINNISDTNLFSFPTTPINNNSIYIKLSWSAIDPVQSFKLVQLYSMQDNSLAFQLNITPSHTINYPLSINIYIDNTSSASLLTHDLHNILFYIVAIVILLSILYTKCGNINTLLLHNIV